MIKKEMSSKNGYGGIEIEIEIGGCLSFSLLSFTFSRLNTIHHLDIFQDCPNCPVDPGSREKKRSFRYFDLLIYPIFQYFPRTVGVGDV
jgi:hypothetical protein